MYTYKEIGFRPIDAGDLEHLRRLYNDESTFLQLGSVGMASTQEQNEWWQNILKSKTDKHFSIVEASTGNVMGKLRIQNIDHVNAHCEVGLDILPEYRGRGYGEMSYQMVLEFLFLHFNMHMVYLRVIDFNDAAKRLYCKLNFVETGRYKEYIYRYGKYWDYVIMCMTKEEYLKMSQRGENS